MNLANAIGVVEALRGFVGSDQEKIKAVYRKMAYLEANKWLKDQGVIEKYKTKRELYQFATKGYQRLVCNLVKMMVSKTMGDVPQIQEVRKVHGQDKVAISIKLDDEGYGGRYVNHNGQIRDDAPQYINDRSQFKDTLEHFLAQTNLVSGTVWHILRDGSVSIDIKYEKLDLLSVQDPPVSIQDFHTLLGQMRQRLWPRPIVTAPAAEDEVENGT